METAHRALGNCGQVFRYAIATGRATRDISADLRGALPPVKGEHFAAITEPKQVGALLRAMDDYTGSHMVRCALRLAPLVFMCPGELRKAEWKDIDIDGEEWRYTVPKTNTPHIVPLLLQAVEILKELLALTGRGRFIFPGARTNGRPMSDNAILAAMRRMGIDKEEMSGHGFLAMARAILDEVLGFRPDFIEHQLAHSVRDPNGRAYNRTAHLPERRKMMQQWADYLDKLKADAEIIPLHGGIKKRVLEKTMSEDNTWPWGLRKPNWDAWQSVQRSRLWHAVALACDLDPGNFQLFDRPQRARSFKEPPKQFEDLLAMAKGNIGANGRPKTDFSQRGYLAVPQPGRAVVDPRQQAGVCRGLADRLAAPGWLHAGTRQFAKVPDPQSGGVTHS